MEAPRSFSVLNDVARDKLAQVLAHVLDKLATNNAEVFSTSEKQQLKIMLSFSDAQIDEMVAATSAIFEDAAAFGEVDRNLLSACGVDDKVMHAVEKMWRKKGRSVREQVAELHPIPVPSRSLQSSEWRLQLEMAQSKQSGLSNPTAVFQLSVADTNAPTKEVEKLDVEMSHAELRALFLQLNAIQAELDAPAMETSVPSLAPSAA